MRAFRTIQIWLMKLIVGNRPVVSNVKMRGIQYHVRGGHAVFIGCAFTQTESAAFYIHHNPFTPSALDLPDNILGISSHSKEQKDG